jgi:hypothetical protein
MPAGFRIEIRVERFNFFKLEPLKRRGKTEVYAGRSGVASRGGPGVYLFP